MLSGFSLPHLIVLLVIIVLVFGTKKLRGLGSDLGGTIKEFKKALNADDDQPPTPPTVPPTAEKTTTDNDQTKPS